MDSYMYSMTILDYILIIMKHKKGVDNAAFW